MEEGVLCLCRCRPFLNIIDYQDVNRLIKIDEIIGCVLANGVSVLNLKQTCGNIQHAFLRIELLDP